MMAEDSASASGPVPKNFVAMRSRGVPKTKPISSAWQAPKIPPISFERQSKR